MRNGIIIVAAEEEAWDIRPMGGVDRISGTELGRRLAYGGKPTLFNTQVVRKLLNEGKINASDMVFEQNPCKRGFGKATVTEYWLSLPLARSIAIEHVRTKVADGLRQQVTAQLERLIGERKMALQEPTDTLALIQAGLDRQTALLERQGELLLGILQQPKSPSIYIDDERAHMLKRMAQDIVTASGGEDTLQTIWQTVQRKYNFIKAKQKSHPRVFGTVTVDRFEQVLDYLRAALTKAVNTPKKTVTSLLQRPVAPTGNALDTQAVSRRLNAVGFDIPAWALPDWGPAEGLYSMIGILTYEAPESGRKSDLNRAVHIDESSVSAISHWCSTHPRELKTFLSNRRLLNATLPARQKF